MDSSVRSAILASAFTSLLVSGVVLFAGITIMETKMGSALEMRDTDIAQQLRSQQSPLLTGDPFSAIVAAVKKAEPAVVSVIISKDLPVIEQYYESPFGDDPFGDFFGIPRSRDTGETERREVGGGTAFFISSDGLLMTNKHVASDEEADYGVLIVRGETASDLAIVPGSPADKAGLHENDIILEADGQKLTLETSLASIIQQKTPGETVKLKISQAGEEKDVTVMLEERK